MKRLFLVLCLVSSSMAISSFTYPWTIKLTGDTATVAKWRANNDSVLAFGTRVVDTMNKGIPRWKGFSNHDSTFKWMNIDTIPSADTIAVKNLKVDKISKDSLHIASDKILIRSSNIKTPLFCSFHVSLNNNQSAILNTLWGESINTQQIGILNMVAYGDAISTTAGIVSYCTNKVSVMAHDTLNYWAAGDSTLSNKINIYQGYTTGSIEINNKLGSAIEVIGYFMGARWY